MKSLVLALAALVVPWSPALAAAMHSILRTYPAPQSSGIFSGLAPRLEQLATAYSMPMPAVR
jgi:hypothetical protein